MSLVLAPDSLALTIGWLKTQAELSALVSGRVMSKLPVSKTYPLVRVSRIGGNEIHGHNHWLHDPLLQVDCYAAVGAESAAFNVARVVAALLSQRFQGAVVANSAVISEVELGGIRQGYDSVDKDIPVAEFDVRLRLHPTSQ